MGRIMNIKNIALYLALLCILQTTNASNYKFDLENHSWIENDNIVPLQPGESHFVEFINWDLSKEFSVETIYAESGKPVVADSIVSSHSSADNYHPRIHRIHVGSPKLIIESEGYSKHVMHSDEDLERKNLIFCFKNISNKELVVLFNVSVWKVDGFRNYSSPFIPPLVRTPLYKSVARIKNGNDDKGTIKTVVL